MVKRVHLILCVSSYHNEKTKINSKKVKNTRSQYLLRTYYILGSTLSRVSSHLILTITLGGKHCYYPHFTDGYTETQRGKATYPRSIIPSKASFYWPPPEMSTSQGFYSWFSLFSISHINLTHPQHQRHDLIEHHTPMTSPTQSPKPETWELSAVHSSLSTPISNQSPSAEDSISKLALSTISSSTPPLLPLPRRFSRGLL